MSDLDLIESAARNLNSARRLANNLETVAGVILALAVAGAALIAGAVFASDDPGLDALVLVPVAVGYLLGGAVLWGLLRALAMSLHLTVDRALLEGEDGDEDE